MDLQRHSEKLKRPIWQAILLLSLGFIAIALNGIFKSTGLVDGDPLFPYQMMAMALFVYALFNSILSISAKDKDKYLRSSILSMIGLILSFGLIAYLFTDILLTDLTTYRNIIFVFCLIYLILSSIVRVLRFLLELASKPDDRINHNDAP